MTQPQNTAVGGAAGLVVKLPFATPEEFLAKYGANITRGGIYLRSKTVKPPGSPATLDLRLADGSRLIYASAVVHFVTGQAGQGLPGMGFRFLQVDPATRRFLDTTVAALPHAQSSLPPLPAGVGPADYTVPPVASEPSEGPPLVPSFTPYPGQVQAPTHTPFPATPPALTPMPMGAQRPSLTPMGAASIPVMARPSDSAIPAVPSAPPFEAPTQEPARTGPIIGIDLGTTNSCAAFVRNGKPAVLLSREGHNTVPSILALNSRGKLVVGHPAKGQMLTNPRQTVYGAKRLVGRPYASPIVREIKDRFAYEIAPGDNGEAAVKLGDRVYSLQQISALILREVKEVAQNQLGQPVSRAVITVPAYYNDNQRQAVREAGRLAGLHVERILNEPTAAALAYGYGRKLTQRVLVYDLGGGTFDASVLELRDNLYEVISTGGDTFLGGIDFDNAIIAYLLEQFRQVHGTAFEIDRVAMQRIHDAAERAKCALSERSELRVHVAFLTMIGGKPVDLDVQLTREKLVQLTEQLVDRTLQTCAEVLAARGLTPRDIDEIILVGGQSRFPLVQEKITSFFGKAPTKNVHPDEVVALGAALLAHSIAFNEGVTLKDVLPMAIGVALPGGRFRPVIERNAKLPAHVTYQLATSQDGQREIELVILQGDSERASDNEYLGTLKISGLPAGPRGSVRVAISFEVSGECILKVTAREPTTGAEVSSVFTTRDTPEQVKAKFAQHTEVPARPSKPVPAATPALARAPNVVAAPKPVAAPPPVTVPVAVAAAANQQAASGGLVGWLRRLFGRT